MSIKVSKVELSKKIVSKISNFVSNWKNSKNGLINYFSNISKSFNNFTIWSFSHKKALNLL